MNEFTLILAAASLVLFGLLFLSMKAHKWGTHLDDHEENP